MYIVVILLYGVASPGLGLACVEIATPAHIVRHLSGHVTCSLGTVCCNVHFEHDMYCMLA